MGQGNAKVDLENYRKGYPNLAENLNINDNYLFYSGKIQSTPDGDYIDQIHKKWWGNTSLLEVHHGYIQWLFPIREHGMNHESVPLQLHEIEKIKADPVCIKRFIKSYEMMLHFYGCRLVDENTGKLDRREGWKEQYYNLNTHPHNFLRITRILKSLGEFGFEHYKKPFLDHFIKEIWENKELSPCSDSCQFYWIGTLKDDQQRDELENTVLRYRPTKTIINPIINKIAAKSNSSACGTESTSTESDDGLEGERIQDEEEKNELKKTMLSKSEDVHDDEDGDDDASDDGNLDLNMKIGLSDDSHDKPGVDVAEEAKQLNRVIDNASAGDAVDGASAGASTDASTGATADGAGASTSDAVDSASTGVTVDGVGASDPVDGASTGVTVDGVGASDTVDGAGARTGDTVDGASDTVDGAGASAGGTVDGARTGVDS